MVVGVRAVATQFGVRVDQGVGTENKVPVGSAFQLVLVVFGEAVQHGDDGVVQVTGGVHGDVHIRLSTRVFYIVMAVQTLYHEFQSVPSEDIHLDAANKSVKGFGFWATVDMFPVEIAINPSGHSFYGIHDGVVLTGDPIHSLDMMPFLGDRIMGGLVGRWGRFAFHMDPSQISR